MIWLYNISQQYQRWHMMVSERRYHLIELQAPDNSESYTGRNTAYVNNTTNAVVSESGKGQSNMDMLLQKESNKQRYKSR